MLAAPPLVDEYFPVAELFRFRWPALRVGRHKAGPLDRGTVMTN